MGISASHARAQENPRPLPKGDRILAIQVNMGEAGDFNKSFNEALEAGNETQVLPQDWNELETAPGKFVPKTNFLAIANSYYPARKMPIHLAIRPIHTNQKVVPTDLMDKPLDDPETIRRFKRLLTWISTQIQEIELASLSIGSEVDFFMLDDPERWQAWTNFYAAVAPYARRQFPGTLISCETTHAALIGPALSRVQEMHQHSDAIGVSYYPMKNSLSSVQPPAVVAADFDAAVKAIAGKPMIFYQIGFPSSPALGSSPELRSVFITETFRAWDRHRDRILMLNFQWMHEAPKAGLDHYAEYYGYDTPNFRAFLGSLGFRSWSGEPKPAWHVLKQEAKVRGFGN